jgi:chromosome partitioning protein
LEIIAMINSKGGVAKTTSIINISSCLVELGKKVLAIDMDPQRNLTQGLNFNAEDRPTLYDCLLNDIPMEQVIYETDIENLHIVPSTIKLAGAEIELSTVLGRESILKDALDKIKDKYDYIMLDCDRSLGLLTVNALTSCTHIVIPLEPGIFALEGIDQLLKVVNLVKRKLNNNLAIKGVLLTRVIARTKIGKEFETKLSEIFSNKVFKTVVHQNVAIANAQTERKPINHYDVNSTGYKEYLNVTKELIERE